MAGWVKMPPMRSFRCRHAMVAVGPHGVVNITREQDDAKLLQDWAPRLMTRAIHSSQVDACASEAGYTAETKAELQVEQAERHARIKRAAKRKTERMRVQQLQSQVLQHGLHGGEIRGGSGRGRRRERGSRGNRVRNMHVAGVDDLVVAAAAAGL